MDEKTWEKLITLRLIFNFYSFFLGALESRSRFEHPIRREVSRLRWVIVDDLLCAYLDGDLFYDCTCHAWWTQGTLGLLQRGVWYCLICMVSCSKVRVVKSWRFVHPVR